MDEPSSEPSPNATTIVPERGSAERELLLLQLRETKKLTRASALRRVEKILFHYCEEITMEMVAFALDPTKDDRARAGLLAKVVEMVRPSKKPALIEVNQNQAQQTVSHLQVPTEAVGPESPGLMVLPPLRQIERAPSPPLRAGELEAARRAPATRDEMYGKIAQQPSDLDVLESEVVEAQDRMGPVLEPRRESGNPVRRGTW
jgi:hypothetical protein